ncbi:MAG: mannose-1-phosphate guanylyltransferase/mannose-6-phosphate isomerase [Rhodobacteraceae bacterium]|nr:mannose-1-phosphate guanylyltransferase/mannose-6-phosphate isomerase [Paracoccaceae bacterium]
MIRPVILCGGSGKRLWPVSRKSMPKQFARLTGEESLLQTTVRRMEDIGCAAPVLMTANDYRFTVGEQMDEIGSRGHKIVIEPVSRNTAPAICAAAEIIAQDDPDALILVAPSDHLIRDTMSFGRALAAGAERARGGEIVTFGIRPTGPETGFGYIELADPEAPDEEAQTYVQFTEKPDQETAERMVASGSYVWNAGIFLFSVRTIRAAFARHAPKLRSAVKTAVRDGKHDLDFFRLANSFVDAPDISIDYAIMEHEIGSVVPVSAGWNDLGSWRSVWQESDRDGDGVGLTGAATALHCKDTLLRSDDDSVQVVGIGLRNIAAVATRDAVLITDLDATQDVGEAVTALKLARAPQAEEFPRHHRPWGYYETLALGSRYQVKSIVVKPGGKLSLQSHVHRAEHWVVVEGTATVTIGSEEKLVGENQSVYIPLGEVHRLANPGKFPLRLIEVQTGGYLGEDDIVRYEDIYERA